MNKIEILEKISANVVRVTSEPFLTRTFGNSVLQYSVDVLINVEGGTQITNQDFYVIDEGLASETATFVNGREVKNIELLPPNRQRKILLNLEALEAMGPVKGIDLSRLGIPFALLEVAGNKLFVAELDGQLKHIEAV